MATGQLQALLDSFEARLSTVEKTVLPGGAAAAAAAPMASGLRGIPAAAGSGDEVSASVVAFDEYCSKCLEPFMAACGTLGGGAAEGVSSEMFLRVCDGALAVLIVVISAGVELRLSRGGDCCCCGRRCNLVGDCSRCVLMLVRQSHRVESSMMKALLVVTSACEMLRPTPAPGEYCSALWCRLQATHFPASRGGGNRCVGCD